VNDAGTRIDGGYRRLPRAQAATTRIEQIEVAISIVGSAVTLSALRNSASRVALPATNWAVTAAAHSIAIHIDRAWGDENWGRISGRPDTRHRRSNPPPRPRGTQKTT